jgi:Tfp pilus assembly protein PilF
VSGSGDPRAVSAAAVVLALAVALVAAGGCSKPAPKSTGSAFRAADATRARSQALVENGNRAFEAGDFALAARRYAAAAVVDPEDPAAYYGMGMALSKLGRDDQAREAYQKSRELARNARARADSPEH